MRTNKFYIVVVILFAVVNFIDAQSRAVYRDSRKITTTAARSFNANGENRRYLKIDGNTSWYFKALGGYNLSSKGAVAGGALGIRLNHFRIEAEGRWSEKNPAVMGVVNYDFIKGPVTPFISVAAGAGKQVTGFTSIENPETGEIDAVVINRKFNFQAAAGAGISFRIAPHFQLEASYRFIYLPKESNFIDERASLIEMLGENGQRTVMSEPVWKYGHEISVALRYHF